MKILKNSLACVLLGFCTVSWADVAVIVNVNNTSAIAEDDIDRIFLGKSKSFENGDKIKPANLEPGNAVREEFETKALERTGKQVKSYWAKLVFSGKATPPEEFATDAEVLEFVSKNKDAIAYVDAGSVNDTVKVVKTY